MCFKIFIAFYWGSILLGLFSQIFKIHGTLIPKVGKLIGSVETHSPTLMRLCLVSSHSLSPFCFLCFSLCFEPKTRVATFSPTRKNKYPHWHLNLKKIRIPFELHKSNWNYVILSHGHFMLTFVIWNMHQAKLGSSSFQKISTRSKRAFQKPFPMAFLKDLNYFNEWSPHLKGDSFNPSQVKTQIKFALDLIYLIWSISLLCAFSTNQTYQKVFPI
jgi:hypothetical protein